ncbi:MAG: hypothetical protein JWO08_3384 [Verrucomicrobiaceae bacterium]|nr:hypothetical protein [Verrucomicrobiaceae bacterium]
MKIATFSLIASIAVVFTNCTSQSLHDVGTMRENALKYYDHQIIDNLVRASNGLPILHVNVSSMQSSITGKGTGSFNGGQSKTTAGLARTILRPLTFTLGGEYSDLIHATSIPLTGDGTMIAPYLRFLNLHASDQRLRSIKNFDLDLSQPMPALGKVEGRPRLDPSSYVPGTCLVRDGYTYYVPTAFRQAYFDLCLELIAAVETGPVPFGARGASKSDEHSGAKVMKSRAFRDEALEELRDNINLLRGQLIR